ncbi:hypothetical protein OG453_02665 [Streptomyces sp. NBC_01381]|uniref:hypothetical protein n=1 Tax=Streptomyces sp. NBC_01381 TaxID=2903845 RepID=UPI00225B5F1A|nr:hypothetical protein [Streptomyces sp. NBC_01381]MCX4665586.1 hypothetical protein [Streptomyces sp. NBC_01381]
MQSKLIRRGAAAAALTVGLVGAGTTGSAHAAQPQTGRATTVTEAAASDDGLARRTAKVRSIGTKCGKKPMALASGPGGMTLSIEETRTRGTVLSKKIDLAKGGISAGVGWDVTRSRSIAIRGTWDVPKKYKRGYLRAYTKYAGKKFNVQRLTMHTENDWVTIQKNKKAWKPIGVCFKKVGKR